jgi:hypothetical protein
MGPWRSQRGVPIAAFEDLGETSAFSGVIGDGQRARVGVAIKTDHGSLGALSAQAFGTNVERIPEGG